MNKANRKTSQKGKGGLSNMAKNLRTSRKKRGVHLHNSEEQGQSQHPNKECGSTSYNVYHRKNQHRVMPDPKIYVDDSQEHTTPRSNQEDNISNENDSVNASGNNSVNRIGNEGDHNTEVEALNEPPNSDDIEEQVNEANRLKFSNKEQVITSFQAPTFNLLSGNETANPPTEERVPQQTNTANVNVAETDQMADQEPVQVVQRKARRGRGRTKMKSKGRREPWESKIELEFDEEGKVCSDNATTFANLCGYYVRKHAPLQITSWENVPSEALSQIFKKIMHHYNIPNDRKIMANILKSCAKKYRAYRSFLKRRYFDKYETTVDRLKNMMKEGADSVRYRAYKKARLKANGEPINTQSKETMDNIEALARDRGIDLDTAMEMVIPRRKIRDFYKVLEVVGIGAGEGASDIVAQRSHARAVQAEKMTMDAQREAFEANQKVEMLEMELAQSQQRNLCAMRGKALAKVVLARSRSNVPSASNKVNKNHKCLSSKRKLTYFDDPSNSEDVDDEASCSQESEEEGSATTEARRRQLKHLSSMQFHGGE